MNKETIVEYSFVILEEYQDLEDGSPNRHYTPSVRVSNKGSIEQFLNSMKANSKIKGLSIVDIEFKIIS